MTTIQIAIVMGMLLVGVAMIAVGIISARRALARRTRGTTIPGGGIGIALGGASIALIGADLRLSLSQGWTTSGFSRWWFLPPNEPGNGLGAALGSPVIWLMGVGALVFFLGIPSAGQLRRIARLLSSPRTRGQTLAVGGGIVAMVALSVISAWWTYIATDSRFLGMLAFLGTALAVALVAVVIGFARPDRPENGGQNSSGAESEGDGRGRPPRPSRAGRGAR